MSAARDEAAARKRNEARAIRRALEEPDLRAFMVTMGALLVLPSDTARRRVLSFVADLLQEKTNAD
jgi:hypothetical protein